MVSEVLFDQYLNYNKTNQETSSFNVLLDSTTGILQKKVDIFTNFTKEIDSSISFNIINIEFDTFEIASEQFTNINYYIANRLPLNVSFIDTTTNTYIDKLILFDNVEVDDNTIICFLNKTKSS